MPPPSAGAAMAEAWRTPVGAYFGRRCARPEDAEDLAQDALCAIMEGAGRFRRESSEATWVYAVCRNVFLAWLRARDLESRRAAAAAREALSLGDGAVAEDPSSGVAGNCPAGATGAEESLCLDLDLRAALASLTPAESRLYRLYYHEGKGVAEVAETLGRPEGTVKYLLARLRETLREALRR